MPIEGHGELLFSSRPSLKVSFGIPQGRSGTPEFFTYLHLNRKPEAKKAFAKYIELAPNSKHLSDVKNKLSSLQ